MTFAEALAEQTNTKCKFGKWLQNQNQPLIAQISAAVANVGIHRTFKALQKMGLTVSESTFYNHQTGNCKCN